jgi:hypothetical protein
LPEEQQAMIERKFGVSSFPTYMLIGKDGKLANDNAPTPSPATMRYPQVSRIKVESIGSPLDKLPW